MATVATPDDVISINPRIGDRTPDDIQHMLDSVEGELLLPLVITLPGIVFPFEASEQLTELVRMAEMYGVAAMIEGGSEIGESPDQMSSSAGYYSGEYQKRADKLAAMTGPQLIALGVVYVDPQSTIEGNTLGGLTLAHNRRWSSRNLYPSDWRDNYGWRRG